MNQDIITTIKQVENKANIDLSMAQAASRLAIIAKETDLSKKLEELEGRLTLEIKEIEGRAQKEIINAEKSGKGTLENAIGKINQINFEKARKTVLDFLLSSE